MLGIPTLLMALFSLAVPSDRGVRAQPNVLFILADDVGTDPIGVYGDHPVPARTPVIDSLAQQGLLFRNTWAAPVCSPARATLLTGRHGFRTGIGWNIPYLADGMVIGSGGPAGLMWSEHFLPRMLQQAGYHTAIVGKWHLSNTITGSEMHPILTGFQHHAGPLVLGGYHNWTKNLAGSWGFQQFNVPEYSTSVFVDDALTFIDAAGSQPWYLWLAFLSAHEPLHVPPLELLSPETQTELAAGTPTGPQMHRAMVEAMDTEIGRLLAGIDPAVLQNTLVIFMADNGTLSDGIEEPASVSGAKGAMAEGGIRVPLILSGAGVVEPGREVHRLTNSVDIYATVLDLAGVPLPAAPVIDGRSLKPLMQDPGAGPVRRYSYAEKFEPNGFVPKSKNRRAIRDERFKLWQILAPLDDKPLRLYDLQLDPLEQDNLLGPSAPPLDAVQQEAFDRLMAQLSALVN